MGIEDKILLEENELKPNRYVANVMAYAIPAFILIELLNEFNIYHVELIPMRACCLITVVSAAIIQLLGRKRNIASRKNAKYWILMLVFISTLAVTVVLSQWSELLLALPITLAMQYHNKKVTYFAIANALIIALISAPLGVLLGLNQINFYEFLLRTTGFQVESLVPIPDFNVMKYALWVLLYISIPRCIIVGALSLICVYTTKLVSNNIQTRAEVTYLSSTDVMTGIYNRSSYETRLDSLLENPPLNLVCIYADADGLHELNNKFGHSAGDKLLKTCASQIRRTFGEDVYRIGGDEFVAFFRSDDMGDVENRIESIRKAMAERGYHVSIGAEHIGDDMDVLHLIRSAEEKMYDAKHIYYTSEGMDRRKNRS